MSLLSGDVASAAIEGVSVAVANEAAVSGQTERITQLETEVSELRRELETLREQFAAFQKQFQ